MLILVRQGNAQGPALVGVHRQRRRRAVGRHEIRSSGPHDETLSVLVVGAARSLDDDEYRVHRKLRQSNVLARFARYDHDLELSRGGRVPHDAIISVGGRAGIDGGTSHGIREHVHQVIHILELGSQAGADHVVAASHALDNLPGNVSVRLVRLHVKALARRDQEVILCAQLVKCAVNDASEPTLSSSWRRSCSR